MKKEEARPRLEGIDEKVEREWGDVICDEWHVAVRWDWEAKEECGGRSSLIHRIHDEAHFPARSTDSWIAWPVL